MATKEITREALDWVPPMMGLDDEIVMVSANDQGSDIGNLMDHYTALLNGRRVWVFRGYSNEDRNWYILATSLGVSTYHEMRKETMAGEYFPVCDPLLLRVKLEQLTSGGNNEQS